MAAHSQITDVIKKDHTRSASWIFGAAQQCTDPDFATTWFMDANSSQVIMRLSQLG
jgi:hypothetical protein